MDAEAWEEERARLHQLAEENFYCPIDPHVEEAVIGLRLLGYDTVGSCEGHMWHPEDQGPTEPFIAIKTRERRGRFGIPSPAMDDPRTASARERQFLALLIWKVNRPRARELQAILDECSRAVGRKLSLVSRADRYGIAVERKDNRSGLTEMTLRQAHEDLDALGAYLRRVTIAPPTSDA